jgi:hypothetical protein
MRMKERSTRARALCIAVALAAVYALPAAGAEVGPRMGLSIDPDQVHAGLVVRAAELTRHFAFQPSFDLGVGDALVGVAANMDFEYVFTQGRGHWSPYLGGGPGLFFWNSTRGDASNTEVGMNFFGGLQEPTRSGSFFGEMRLGLMNNPQIKFTVGWLLAR